MIYDIKRGNTVIASIKPTGTREERIMGIDIVPMSFTLNYYIEFLKNDTVIVDGATFYLEKPSDFENAGKWTYNLKFLSEGYFLSNYEMLALDENNVLTEYDCYYTGTASGAIDLIVANANRVGSGWTKGVVDDTEAMDFDFSGDNCSSALTKLANAHKIELWIENKKIHLTKKGADSGLSFQRGKGKGLTKLIRKTLDNKPVTRLRVYGSKKNLPATYPGLSKRLRMPDGALYIQQQAKVDKYGLIEDTAVFEDIFPKRTGKITAVSSAFTFSDSSIDFDINSQRIAGVPAKVKFVSGQLSGYQFDITEKGYVHATKTITINVNKDERAIEVPSATGLKPAVGDQYILIDLVMPQSWINAAQVELAAKALEKYNESSDPRVQFEAPTDRRYLRDNNITVKLGDFVTIKEPSASINQNIRIISKVTNLQDKFDVTIELADSVSVASIVQQTIADSNVQKAVKMARITDVARQRLMWRTTSELSTMIDTLRAEMLLIVTDGGEYVTDVVFETSVDAIANKFSNDAGVVDHQKYIENGGQWVVSASTQTVPTTGAYYIYIKASKVSNAASVIYSVDKLAVDSDPSYYYLPYGILSSVIDGTRIFSTVYGYTRVTGNNITTGIIEGPSGLLKINMQTGEIFGKLTFRGTDGTVKDIQSVDDISKLAKENAAIAQATANNAATAAANALTSAIAANTLLADIANDNLLVPSEKQDILKEWQIIQSELSVIQAQATNYSISNTGYTSAYNALNTYATPLLSSLTTNSTIVGTTFRTTFKNYYDARTALLKLISDKAKTLADAAQTQANTATSNAATAQVRADLAVTNAANAQTAATNAQTSASNANNLLSDIASDSKLTPVEKKNVKLMWDEIVKEYPTILLQAGTYNVPTSAYATNYSTLSSYITPLIANLSSTSNIVIGTFQSNFSEYYDSKFKLLQLISDAAKSLVDNITIGGRNYANGTTGVFSVGSSGSANDSKSAFFYGTGVMGKEVTVSFDWTIDSGANFSATDARFAFQTNGTPSFTAISTTVRPGSAILSGRSVRTMTMPAYSGGAETLRLSLRVDGITGTIRVTKFKIELGNKVSDWTPSPEDVINDAQSKADAAQAASQVYTVAQDAYNLTVSNAYADGKVTAEEQARIDQAAANLATAKADATTKANAAQMAAQNAAAVDAQTKATSAQNAARTYADAQDTLKKVETQAYADGIVTAEEQARINQAAANLAAAKTDATTKANAAQAAALLASQLLVDGISVGGTNRALRTGTSLSITGSGASNQNVQSYSYNSSITGKQVTVSFDWEVASSATINDNSRIAWQTNGTPSFSTISQSITPTSSSLKGHSSRTLTWPAYSGSAETLRLQLRIDQINGGITISNFQLELGNKESDWSPAPSDANVYADQVANSAAIVAKAEAIATASNDAQTKANVAYSTAVAAAGTDASTKANAAYASAQTYANSKYTELTNTLGAMAYQDVVELAKLGTTVISGGLIRTTLLDVAAIKANIITASNINALVLTSVQGTIGGIQIQSNQIRSSNGNFSVTSAGVLTATQANISGAITATSGTIGGFVISATQMTGTNNDGNGGRFVLNPTGGLIAFVNDSDGSFSGIGSSVVSAATGVNILARFDNKKPNSGGTNYAMRVSASGASTNVAIDIPSGTIRVRGYDGIADGVYANGTTQLRIAGGVIVGLPGFTRTGDL